MKTNAVLFALNYAPANEFISQANAGTFLVLFIFSLTDKLSCLYTIVVGNIHNSLRYINCFCNKNIKHRITVTISLILHCVR